LTADEILLSTADSIICSTNCKRSLRTARCGPQVSGAIYSAVLFTEGIGVYMQQRYRATDDFRDRIPDSNRDLWHRPGLVGAPFVGELFHRLVPLSVLAR
jgi:hypothetical protein